jgi:hypothetical protein
MSGLAQDVEVRLAEIDRRLREIQADLIPGRTPRGTRMPATGPPPPVHPEAPPPSRPPEARRAPHQSLPTGSPVSAPGRSGPLSDALEKARRRRDPDPFPEQIPDRRRAAPESAPLPSALPPPEPPESAPPQPGAGLPPELQSGLLAATRALLAAYERAVSSPSPLGMLEVSVSAAPFSSTDALHAFERALAQIPGVLEVAVRGYEGPDRAILEVQLERATPREPST